MPCVAGAGTMFLCVCMCRRAHHSWGFFVSLCSTTGTSTSNSSTVVVSSGTALQVTVSMSGEEWNCTNVHIVAGMDVTTQEACSTAFEGNTIVTSCVPIAVVVAPTSCAASDDGGSDSGSSSGSRRALGVVSGSASPSSSPSPGTLPSLCLPPPPLGALHLRADVLVSVGLT